ncbi:MAG TPA: hypothetical protein VMA72_15535 [Streptosporangiaceae bacterium]|nr:hypothetical protein [Streptosporangiaceae bacterium]
MRRRRRLRAIGTPALAAVAVAAIAISSISLPRSHDAAQQQRGAAATARHFSALSPYATFGWLPAKEPVVPGHKEALAQLGTGMGGVISWNLEDLSSGPWQLKVYAVGECQQAGGQLQCAKSLEQDPCALARESPALPVNGHQTFWLAGSGTQCLNWEYAPGGWATLYHYNEIRPGKQLVLRIASAIRFGGHQPSFKFAAQLRNLPGKWRVVFASFGVRNGTLQAGGFKIAEGSSATGVEIDMTPANAKHNRCERLPTKRTALLCREINGYYVNYLKPPKLTTPSCPPGKICATPIDFVHIWASDADGWNVDLMAGTRHFGLLFPVFEHMTVFGRNPATWTTKPIS